jgi:hypothetical protein
MAFDLLQIEERPKDYWVRIKRIMRLLLLIAALVLLDGFNRQLSLYRSYGQLRSALYDFTVKYKKPLDRWYRAAAAEASTQDVVVRFEVRYAGQGRTPGYSDLGEVPLLQGYLEDRLPTLTSENRRFLGYEMVFEIYLVLVVVVPTALLVGLAWNLFRLQRSWVSSASVSSRLLDDLPFFGNKSRRRMRTLKAVSAVLALLVLTLWPPFIVLGHQVLVQPVIKGELFVEPVGLASIPPELSFLVLPWPVITGWVRTVTLILLLDLMISGFVLRIMLRRKPSRKTPATIT